MRNYNRISSKNREEIMVYSANGNSQETIAKKTGFSQSTISRELKKGEDRSVYNPFLAQRKITLFVKHRYRTLKKNDSTWRVIQNHLAIRWSPYEIMDLLHKSANDATIVPVSEKTIYNYLNFLYEGGDEKAGAARTSPKRQNAQHEGNKKRGKPANITLIDERPEEVNARTVPGHWEGDLIIGKDHKSALSVIVEQQTR
ncbi:hypothetical protein SPIRO4BDMA_40237 [uncultured spirochete]|uniref:Transposase IS30-like HTH domain-containing protein n=1 Tax=uncultured spirochete TaxID=156406 RepID=A0A3P3XN17_9SPIR|nr:hypothetical protein SPIRO4BDMA_40237 [uncultured spirochete]